MRILAVDDDPVMLDLLGTALESSGFDEITFAASAEDALELIEITQVPYDIFLLDVMLPNISGIEVCAKIRTYSCYRAAPILMITASRARDMMARAFEAGATDFVSKPFDMLELISRINLAAMINDSLQREKMNAQAVEELGRLTEVSFDERFDMPVGPGVKGFLALENELLRRADAMYTIELFSVQIDNALGLYRGSRPAQFRSSVETVSRALSCVVDINNTRFAYAGRGAMIGVVHAGMQIDLKIVEARLNTALEEFWDSFTTGQPTAVTVTVQPVAGGPVWSGRRAADAMRSFQGRADLAAQADPYVVDGLFERLSMRIAGG